MRGIVIKLGGHCGFEVINSMKNQLLNIVYGRLTDVEILLIIFSWGK